MENLELKFNSERPPNWIDFISTIIDPKTISLIKITGQVIYEANSDMIVDITNLLRKTCNVSSLNICFNFFTGKSSLTAIDICSMTPTHVKYLTVSIKDLVEAATVLYRLQHLSSVKFFFDHCPTWKPFIAELENQKKGSTYHTTSFSICIWLRQNNLQYKQIKAGNKRIKLTDDHDNV